ncbi:uncharacterized protein [Nicotiana sylvestris]|uniref:uncharacterized protein n=1 Tax=Nicotiana sylvestris TaxID=4096 RepID=UPI00388C5758
MKDDESIQDMHTRFTSIIIELHSLGETIPRNKLVRKILSILPSPWESKVNAITKSKDLQEMTSEELIGNLKTYEMKKKIDSERREPKKEKNLTLHQRLSSLEAKFSKNNPEKAVKRNPVPFKDFKRKRSVDNVMKQALAAWRYSSGESEDETNTGDSSMMVVEGKENGYDSTFALMAQSDDDEDDDNKEGTVKRSGQQWFMDSGCSKHMTGNTMDFLSLKALQEGSVSFGNGKKGYILGVGKVGKSLTHSIENMYYINGLKYTLLSVSQICDKGNRVEFLSKICIVTDLVTGEVVLMAKRYKNIYVADFKSLQSGDLSCLKAVDDDAELWHRRLGHATPRTPQQNGVVERKNRTLEEMERTMLIDCGIAKNFWAEAVNTACYLVNRCMIRSLLNKNPYELLNGRMPKLNHLRTFGYKCYVLNNGKDQLGKFDAKSYGRIFLGYSSQSKAYKIYNKRTQCVEESVHVIFDESYPSCEKSAEEDQDGEPLLVPGEDIDITNGKVDMMSQVKEMSEDNNASSPMEPNTSITTTESDERVVDVVQGTPLVLDRRTQENQSNAPTSS